MNDRRIFWLLYSLLALTALNLGATLYFQLGKSSKDTSITTGNGEAATQVSDKEATDFARGIVDLYNENKIHDLYLRFDDLARVQFSEEKLTEQTDKLHGVVGHVEEFAYSNTEVAGKDGGRTYLALNFKVRLSGGTFNSGTLKLTVTRKDGHLSLFGFYIGGQSN